MFLKRTSLILLFTLLPSSFIFAGDIGFVATTLPISSNQTGTVRAFDQISRKISRIIAYVSVSMTIKYQIPGVSFREVKIPCPSEKEFEKYLKNDTKDCQKKGKLIALTAPYNRSGMVRFFHEKRNHNGNVYLKKLAQQQGFGIVVRSFLMDSGKIAWLGEKPMAIEIIVAVYMPENNTEQLASIMIHIDENMRFSGKEMVKDLESEFIEIFSILKGYQEMGLQNDKFFLMK